MAKVFDYVVPVGRVAGLVDTLEAYLRGDESKLKWLIDFRITDASRLSREIRLRSSVQIRILIRSDPQNDRRFLDGGFKGVM